MAFDAGSVFVTLGGKVDPTAFRRFEHALGASVAAAAKAERAMVASADRTGRAQRAMGAAAVAAKVGIVGLGAGVGVAAAVMVSAAQKAMGFEKQMKSFGAVTGATGRQIQSLSKLALNLGASTGLGATKAAEALTELGKGGVKVRDMSGALKGTLALAAAGELEVADAAVIAANALNLFKLRGADTTHVADLFAQAANSTTASVGDMGMALTQGGAAARAAGYSLDQTVVTLEALALAGVKNSDAGTSMKAAFLQLINPTAKQADASKAAGLSFVTQAGNMKSASDISEMLRAKTEGMTKAQRTALFATLAGTDGLRTLLALYDAGPSKLDRLAESHKKQGDAARVAAEKQEGAAGSIQRLKAAFESAQIIVGQELLPVIAEQAEKAAVKLRELADSGDLARLGKDLAKTAEDSANALDDILKALDIPGAVSEIKQLKRDFEQAQSDWERFKKNEPIDLFGTGPNFEGDRALREIIAKLPKDAKATITVDDGEAWDRLGALAIKLRKVEDAETVATIIADADSTLEAIKLVQDELDRLAGKGFNFEVDDDQLELIRALHLQLAEIGKEKVAIEIESTAQSQTSAIKALDAAVAGVPRRVIMQILNNAPTAKSEVAALEAAVKGVPLSRIIRIIQNADSSKDAVNDLKDAIDRLPASKRVHILTVRETRDVQSSSPSRTEAPGSVPRLKKAAGTKTSGPEFALIGEGAAPEYVIPTEPRYRGRAIGLLMQAAEDLGIMGYKAGGKTGRNLAIERAKVNHDKAVERLAALRKAGKKGAALSDAILKEKETAEKLADARRKGRKTGEASEPGSGLPSVEGAPHVGGAPGFGAATFGELPAVDQFPVTPGEQAALDQLDADLALAELTPETTDDLAVLRKLLGLEEGMLGERRRAGAPPRVIADLARMVKATREQITSLTQAPDQSADLQAQLAQANERLSVAQRERDVNAGALSVFGQGGDLGMGLGNRMAYNRGGTVQNIYTLHPGDPRTLDAIGRAATGGQGLQGSRRRTSVGVF